MIYTFFKHAHVILEVFVGIPLLIAFKDDYTMIIHKTMMIMMINDDGIVFFYRI